MVLAAAPFIIKDAVEGNCVELFGLGAAVDENCRTSHQVREAVDDYEDRQDKIDKIRREYPSELHSPGGQPKFGNDGRWKAGETWRKNCAYPSAFNSDARCREPFKKEWYRSEPNLTLADGVPYGGTPWNQLIKDYCGADGTGPATGYNANAPGANDPSCSGLRYIPSEFEHVIAGMKLDGETLTKNTCSHGDCPQFIKTAGGRDDGTWEKTDCWRISARASDQLRAYDESSGDCATHYSCNQTFYNTEHYISDNAKLQIDQNCFNQEKNENGDGGGDQSYTLYIVIGVSVLLFLLIILLIVKKQKKQKRRMRNMFQMLSFNQARPLPPY